MIDINPNYQIKINYVSNLNQKQTVKLKIYKKINVLNGSWSWLNDEQVTSLMDKGHKKNTLQAQLDYLKKINKSKNDVLFAIYFRNKHIGNVGLHQINHKLKTAQFGIIIGNTNYHNRQIGKHVWCEIIKFGFTKLKIKKFYTMITTNNIASNKIAKNLGFKKMKKTFFFKKNQIKFDYPRYYLTNKLFRKEV